MDQAVFDTNQLGIPLVVEGSIDADKYFDTNFGMLEFCRAVDATYSLDDVEV